MSVQSVTNSTAALNAPLMQAESSSSFDSSDSQSLPQLTSNQLQQLRQALQQDLQQAFASQSSGGSSGSGGSTSGNSSGSVQSQLDQSVSNTLGQFGFSDSQKQTVLDKLNQALSGPSGGHARRGHGRHHAQQALNSVLQTLQSNSAGQTSGANGSDPSSSPPTSLLGAVGASPSTSSGQSLDLLA